MKGLNIFLLAAMLAVSGCTQTTSTTTTETTAEVQSHIVEITQSGFSPSVMTVKNGETVTFTNMVSRPSWPASNVHPTHTLYPGSDIQKCATPEEAGIFDACRGLNIGDSFFFTFMEVGTWVYHDHLSPFITGQIIVEE
jgi:plastocyanin